ncbi:MAG: inositol monophosphatase, partial [Pseudonocardia sp.]|nr:inositol monophosphatase [Pseudonocardia sp.]
LDLCWTACGRYDAYYERGVKHWDVAAGTLVAERAGLAVRTLPPGDAEPAGVAVAAPDLIEDLMTLIAPATVD